MNRIAYICKAVLEFCGVQDRLVCSILDTKKLTIIVSDSDECCYYLWNVIEFGVLLLVA